MATNNTSSSNPRAEKMGDVLDALSSGIAKTAANEPKFEPKLLVPEVPAEPARELLTEKKCLPIVGCVQSRDFSAGAPSARARSTSRSWGKCCAGSKTLRPKKKPV